MRCIDGIGPPQHIVDPGGSPTPADVSFRPGGGVRRGPESPAPASPPRALRSFRRLPKGVMPRGVAAEATAIQTISLEVNRPKPQHTTLQKNEHPWLSLPPPLPPTRSPALTPPPPSTPPAPRACPTGMADRGASPAVDCPLLAFCIQDISVCAFRLVVQSFLTSLYVWGDQLTSLCGGIKSVPHSATTGGSGPPPSPPLRSSPVSLVFRGPLGAGDRKNAHEPTDGSILCPWGPAEVEVVVWGGGSGLGPWGPPCCHSPAMRPPATW